MAEATTSRYESNYIKIFMVVLRVSQRAVRVQFDKEFYPVNLQRTLQIKWSCLSELKRKKRITQPQWNLLFPRTGEQPSSKDFDITLMICLLRYLIPIDIRDRLPSATDTRLAADLSRIKFYRNLIIHCDSALVDDTDFESYWNDVTPAILRLGGNSLKVECDDWYGRNLDAERRDEGLKRIKDEVFESSTRLCQMAEATTSRYESNYIKIAMVVLRVSPRAVRVQFDKEFYPVNLQSTLKIERSRLLNLQKKKRITQPQWNLLFPKTGEPSSKDFDITLMICLLRYLIPIEIMDNRLPSATDTSLRADLSRIKFYRNLIIHCDSALVDDTDFESYWNDVTPAILRLGGNSLKVDCDDWYVRNLDAERRDEGLKRIKDEVFESSTRHCQMAEATTSRYESNYIKIAMVVLRVSPHAVRVEFDKEFDPVCLQITLESEKCRLLDLQINKRITQPQLNLLNPRRGEQPSSKDFDITLMICLLRNLIPIDIRDRLPSATDRSLAADLSRIKFYSNFILFCDGALADTDFESIWNDITPAILRLGGNSLKEECDDWYGRNLDAEQRDDGLKRIKAEVFESLARHCLMAEGTTSRHDSSYIKIAMVVLRVSSRAVRVQFDKEFHPDCLQRTLKSEWSRLSELQMKKCITQPQWNLLFPKTGEQPSSKDFDITLMICLLRNLLPIDIRDRLPLATDTSLAADLSRIKFYSNFILFCDGTLADTDFESIWNDVTPAILRLSGNSLKEECDDWYGRNLDAEQRDDGLKCIKAEVFESLIRHCQMAEATTSRYESNYIKIAMEMLLVSPRAVRVQFDKEFHPDCLQRTLKRKRDCLLDLQMKKCITQPQWNLLFPRTGEQPSSKDFDITLMICLLRNLMPIDIMDNRLPSATDTSLRADLSRIKYYRNIIVHCNSALVDDTDFESYWNDVTPAILRLGGNSLKVECDDWYGRNLDAKQRDNGLKYIKDEKRLALVEEQLAETNKKLIELEQEKRKELAETKKKLIELEQEQSKELAETKKKLIKLEQEQCKEIAETKKKLIELEQEQSKLGKY